MSRLRRASSLRRARASSNAPVFVSGSEHAVPRIDIAAVQANSSSSSSSSSSGSSSSTATRVLPRASSSISRSARLRALLRKVSAPIITSPGRAASYEQPIDNVSSGAPVSKQGSPRRTKSPREPKMGRARSNSLSQLVDQHFKTSETHTIVIYCDDLEEMLIAKRAPAFLIVDDKYIDDDMRAALDRAFHCQFGKHDAGGRAPIGDDETAIKAEAVYLCDTNARLPQGAAYAYRRLHNEAAGASRREKERTHNRLLEACGALAKTRVKEGHVRPQVKHLNVSHTYFFVHP